VIHLTRSGTTITRANGELVVLREEFSRVQCIRLRQLIDADLLRTIHERLAHSEFRAFESTAIGRDWTLADPALLHLLYMLANDPPFLQAIRDITGCEEIAMFQGRVYHMDPALGHDDSWHDDMRDNRLIAMSVNLSPAPFEGSAFQLRDRRSGEILHEVANTGLGDAIIFRIAGHLQHRNTELTGSALKTAFAGWFRSHQPDYYAWIRDQPVTP